MSTYAELFRDRLQGARAGYQKGLDALPGAPSTPDEYLKVTFLDRYERALLAGVLRDLDAALAGRCPEDPQRLAGQPLGQYHCPSCGCMVIGGLSWHSHDDGCYLGLNEIQLDEPIGVALLEAKDSELPVVAEWLGRVSVRALRAARSDLQAALRASQTPVRGI